MEAGLDDAGSLMLDTGYWMLDKSLIIYESLKFYSVSRIWDPVSGIGSPSLPKFLKILSQLFKVVLIKTDIITAPLFPAIDQFAFGK